MDRYRAILICAPANAAADNIAERLSKIPHLRGLFVRVLTERLENIIQVDINNLPEYSLLYKMFNHPISTSDELELISN